MAQQVVAETFKHEQTGKIHLVNVKFPPQMWHCYCSFKRYNEPIEREINLDDEDVCSTCVAGYREKHGGEVEETNTETKSALSSTDNNTKSNSALSSPDSALD